MKYRGAIAGFIWGTLYALLCGYLFSLGKKLSVEYIEFVSIGMLIIAPVSVGMVTVFFANSEQAKNKNYRRYYPWLPVTGWSIISLALAWETIICILMLLPLYLPLATIGGVIGGHIRIKYCNKTNRTVVTCFAFLPFLIVPIETPLDSPTIRHSVTNTVVIDAPVNQVWASLSNIENIKPAELPWTLSHYIGIPKPVSATTKQLTPGGIRELHWDKGVHFQEKITKIEQHKLFAYDVIVDEESMMIADLDTHIVVGDKYFDIESGQYSLSEENGMVHLSLTTAYRMTSKVNWYGSFWANYVLDDFHNAVLVMIKNRNEKIKQDS